MKKMIVITIVLIGILGFHAAVWACFSGEKEYIVVFSKGISWEDAAAEAGGWGDSYHLATVTSRQEQKYLQGLLRGLHGEFWIGGYQDAQNQWQWVTGEPWGYKRWGRKEPNDFYGNDSEQYLALWSKDHRNRWIWNEEGNLKNITGFIVERERNPNDPPTVVPLPGAFTLFGSGLGAMLGLGFGRRKGFFRAKAE